MHAVFELVHEQVDKKLTSAQRRQSCASMALTSWSSFYEEGSGWQHVKKRVPNVQIPLNTKPIIKSSRLEELTAPP